ncbi:MAG TPA: VOC family protein [Caulobacteraceae bacterium]|nr:VOC family protein [Caulobacteraceae bacterium]
MAAQFRHLALNADDVQRAKGFYESVFGWRCEPWGPPDYYQVWNAAEGVIGALQQRRELKPGVRMAGFEATLSVDDLDATIAAIEAAGGRMLSRPFYIETVGRLVYFEDTEGNIVGAMQYDAGEATRIASGTPGVSATAIWSVRPPPPTRTAGGSTGTTIRGGSWRSAIRV